VSVRAFEIDREVVEAYEELYMNDVIGLEVTKPSEQAFKALFTPKQRGGSLLMFSDPVGRQEDDNVRFLRRHRLLPSLEVQEQLNELFATGKKLLVTKEMLLEARRWRGLMLPLEGVIAGVAIQLLRETGIFSAMNDFAGFVKGHTELTSEGVRRMWELVGV
jgi:hypothetical protein